MTYPSSGTADRPRRARHPDPEPRPGSVAARPCGWRRAGEVGNFIVTGHRTSHDAPFRDLPSVRRGRHVLVRQADVVYDYAVTGTLRISFRSEASKALQSAPVPGRPGKLPSTDDHAVHLRHPRGPRGGQLLADEFDNPEHRIDKIGVLTAVRPAPADSSTFP